MGAVGADRLLDLDGELAGGDDDEDADLVAGRAGVAPGLVEAVDDRQHEGGGLAGAGLGAGEQVAALEDEGDGRALDRGGGLVPLVGDGSKQLGRQPETIE